LSEYQVLGKSIPRLDSAEKVSGYADFGDDLRRPGCLTAKLLLSPHPHAEIKKIDTTDALKIPGVHAVVTADDFSGIRHGRLVRDEPLLAIDKVLYVGERVAAVAAETPEAAQAALEKIHVDYKVLPAVFTTDDAMKDDAPLLHDALDDYASFPGIVRYGNVAADILIRSGDPIEAALASADFVFEDEYETPRVHQNYLEPRAMLAEPGPEDSTIVYSPTQGAFVVRAIASEILELPMNKLRVVSTHVGGAFGGKSQHLMEALAVLLSRKSNRPVQLTLNREEETITGNPRHAYRMRYRTGVTREGKIIARHVQITSNNGAYCMTGPMVLGKSCYTSAGPYKIPNVRVDGLLVYTNLPPSGSYRGLGVAQVAFACERHTDRIASELQMDPLAFRIRNGMDENDEDPAGTILQSVSIKETLERAGKKAGWGKQKKENRNGRIRRGMGIGCARYPTGGGASGAVVKVNEDGGLAVLAGCADLGTGAATVMAQVAAEVLGAEVQKVSVRIADTETTPFDAISAGSRTTFNMAHAVRMAAEDAREQMLRQAARMLESSPEDLSIGEGNIFVRAAPSRAIAFAEVAFSAVWKGDGPVTGCGSYRGENPPHRTDNVRGHPEPSRPGPEFATQIAEVEIDTETGETRVVKITSAQDVGFAMNPLTLNGQIEGGIAQGLGWALAEQIHHEEGLIAHADFESQLNPTSLDVSEIASVIVESPDVEGPYGAKGAGEMPLIPAAPAIVNAIADAIGDPANPNLNRLPIAPEDVVRAVREKSAAVPVS